MTRAALFPGHGGVPKSAETSLVAALKTARAAGLIGPLDAAAVGNARQSARALDRALRDEERADNVASLTRAHRENLRELRLTPASRLPGPPALGEMSDPLADLGFLHLGPTVAS